jgi:signal transduction histidine kinase
VQEEERFSKLISLACHDLRTPLATVYGFARTISRAEGLDPTLVSYSEMIETASQQLAELLDELSLAARIEGGRYDPKLESLTTGELAAAAAERLGAERVGVSGDGAAVMVDPEATRRSVSALVQCALRHGGLEHVDVVAEVAVMHVGRLGGSVTVDGETLTVRLPT